MTALCGVVAEEIYELMHDGKRRSNSEIAKALGRKHSETRAAINHMLRTGELRAIPSYKRTLYERS